MSLLDKFKGGSSSVRDSRTVQSPAKPAVTTPTASGSARSQEQAGSVRVSNGLKEFLWNLDGLGRGTLLDLGPAWQTTLNFFIERGFRVSSEDVLRGWKNFIDEEEVRLREDPSVRDTLDVTPEGRASRFLKSNLQYPPGSFDAVLLWDVLDFMEPALTKVVISSITDLLRPAGIVLAMFHSKKAETFHRYRIADSSTLQVVPAAIITPAQKPYQNREIQDLFRGYRTTKSFVGRDQLRENLFIK